MADTTNTIDIAVADKVDSGIAPKFIAIADASDRAEKSIASLKAQLATLGGSGISSLNGQLNALQNNLLKVAKAQQGLASQVAANTAAKDVDKNATVQLGSAVRDLSTAQGTLTGATTKATAATVEQGVASKATARAVLSQREAYSGAEIASGALSGSIHKMSYGFARLSTTSNLVGKALAAMFPVFIALALVDIVYRLSNGLYEVVKNAELAAHNLGIAFDSAISSIRKENDALAVTNDKLDQTIEKLSHRPTSNGAALAIDEARQAADRLDDALQKVQNSLDQIFQKNSINFIEGLLTDQGGTYSISKLVQAQFNTIGQARANATAAENQALSAHNPKAAQAAVQAAYANERKAIQSTIDTLNAKYNVLKKIQDQFEHPTFTPVGGAFGAPYMPSAPGVKDETANLTILGKSVQLAQEDMRGLDLTMQNISKNNVVDKLRDSTSAFKVETKAAAEQWKELEAAFVAFQTKIVNTTGRKATAQQDLNFLVGKEATVNPLNAGKLQAKELPYRNQVANQSFAGYELQRLQDEVSTIGLYNNALKEAATLNRMLEEAKRRNVTVSAQQVEQYKALIKQIVENQEYGKALNETYNAAYNAALKYSATLEAVTTLHQRGQLTEAQYTQGIAETTKQYNEATSAITKFKNALTIQELNQGNRTGTDRQLAARQTLEGLDQRLRSPGADASHPFGYSEAEIKKVNDALEPLILAQQNKAALDRATNALLEQRSNLQDKIITQDHALEAAAKAGVISQSVANAGRLKGQAQLNQQAVDNGTLKSKNQPFLAGLSQDYLKNWEGTAKGIQNVFQPVFKTLSDGFADSIGRAVAYSKNLGDALKDVARSAVQELISALIKLAIQMFVIKGLETALGFSGGGSVGSSAASGVAGHATGGWISGPGSATSDSIVARLSNGEFVVSAAAASRNRALLQSINNGFTPGNAVVTPQSKDTSGRGPGLQTKIEVHNYGSSHVEAQQIDETTVRLIVRDETPRLIAQHAPGVIAGDIANPNGKTAKAINRNVTISRIR